MSKKRASRYKRTEEELPESVRAEIVSHLEKMVYGNDYVERAGKYLFTEKAFVALATSPAATEAAVEPTPAGNSAVVATEELKLSRYGTPPSSGAENERALIVLQLPQNPRMVVARSSAHGTLNHHVQVGDQTLFVVGMPLNAVPHPQEPAFWKAVAPLPRMKGRW